MKMFVAPSNVYVYTDKVDFRKSINGLVMLIEQELALSPFSEALFVFCNQRRDKIKIVYWDKTGFAMWYKVLQKDRFKWPNMQDKHTLHLTEQQLHWLLNGMDIRTHKPLPYTSLALD